MVENTYCSIHPDVPVYCCACTECRICWNRYQRHKKQGIIPEGLSSRFYDFNLDMKIEEAKIAYDKAEEQLNHATSETERASARRAMQAAEEKRDKAIAGAFKQQHKTLENEKQQKLQQQKDEERQRQWICYHSSPAEAKDRLREFGVVFPEDH